MEFLIQNFKEILKEHKLNGILFTVKGSGNLFENIENIKLRYSAFYPNRTPRDIKARKSHIVIFVTEGVACHDFDGKKIETSKGSFIFIPQGYSYKFYPETDDVCSYITLSFYADIEDAYPVKYSIEGLPDADNFATNYYKSWRTGTLVSKHRCLSMLHTLIAHILWIENTSYSNKTKRKIIEPAVIHLENHIFDHDLRIDTLPALCNISPSYFRKIFSSVYGTNPQNFIEDKRLTYAKSLIENDATDTISEIAEMVGYNDPLYFGKVFKKKYGVSPSRL